MNSDSTISNIGGVVNIVMRYPDGGGRDYQLIGISLD